MTLHIDITPIIHQLEATYSSLPHNEFSGYGFLTYKQDEKKFLVYDWALLDVGSLSRTVIAARQSLNLNNHPSFPDLRMWIHAHPMGNGTPGQHNWSSTDERTIKENPLSGPPELIKWSTSIVRTPLGWVGRFDNHLDNQTAHIDVWPGIKGYIKEARAMKKLEPARVPYYDEVEYPDDPEFEYYESEAFGDLQPQGPPNNRGRGWRNWFRRKPGISKNGDGSLNF
jgi:hypothetical protein